MSQKKTLDLNLEYDFQKSNFRWEFLDGKGLEENSTWEKLDISKWTFIEGAEILNSFIAAGRFWSVIVLKNSLA